MKVCYATHVPSEIIIFTDANGWYGFARYAGAYKIATELRRAGFTVQTVDFFSDLTESELSSVIDKYVDSSTLYAGFSTTLWTQKYNWESYVFNSYEEHIKDLFPRSNQSMSWLIDKLKEKNIKIVVGGAKAESLHDPRVDIWAIGQADVSSVALAKHLKYGTPLKLHGNQLRSQDYMYNDFSSSSIIWSPDDYIFKGESLPIEVARGCIFRCAFCHYPLNGKKRNAYIRESNSLRNEMQHNYDHFGTQLYMVTDDLFNDSMEKVENMHALFTSMTFKIEWSSFARLDLFVRYKNMAVLLKESGLKSVFFGIETFSHKSGIQIGKGLSPEILKDTLYRLRDIWGDDVLISAGFIAGLPGETEESLYSTFDWLLDKNSPIDVADVGVLCVKKPIDKAEPGFTYSRIGDDPQKFGYHFDENGHWHSSEMSQARAADLVKYFYNDPRFLKKKRFAALTMNSRIHNIGYSFEDCQNITYENSLVLKEMNAKRANLKNEYILKLMS